MTSVITYYYWHPYQFALDYDESNYDEYFDQREEKIERGDIVVKDYDVVSESVTQFEAIDWSIFGDYTDYYYDYWILLLVKSSK